MGGSRSGFCLWVLLSQWPFSVGVASGAEEEPSSRGLSKLPSVWVHSVGREEYCFLPQGTFQERASRAHQWVPSTGIHTI